MGRAFQAASARSTPRTEPRISGLEKLAQRNGRIDETHVGVGLREVSKQLARTWFDILGKQSDGIRVTEKSVEERGGFVEAPDHRERLRPPERTNREGAGRVAEVVLVAISQHQAVFHE